MPRIARITYPQGFYHVYNRGLNKELLFRDSHDYHKLLSTISDLLNRREWIIYAYCLMPNHYHFLVEEKQLPVSKLISRIFTSYSQYFNRKYKRTGPLFQDRFKSKIIQKNTYFLELSRYIHCNPVKAGLAKQPQDYLFSSMGEYVQIRPPMLIFREKVLKLLDNTKSSLDDYVAFVNAGTDQDLRSYDPFLSKQDVVGSSTFATHRILKNK